VRNNVIPQSISGCSVIKKQAVVLSATLPLTSWNNWNPVTINGGSIYNINTLLGDVPEHCYMAFMHLLFPLKCESGYYFIFKTPSWLNVHTYEIIQVIILLLTAPQPEVVCRPSLLGNIYCNSFPFHYGQIMPT